MLVLTYKCCTFSSHTFLDKVYKKDSMIDKTKKTRGYTHLINMTAHT